MVKSPVARLVERFADDRTEVCFGHRLAVIVVAAEDAACRRRASADVAVVKEQDLRVGRKPRFFRLVDRQVRDNGPGRIVRKLISLLQGFYGVRCV